MSFSLSFGSSASSPASAVGLSTPVLKDRIFSVPLDPSLLDEIERQAETIGTELAQLVKRLQTQLHDVAGHTLESVQVHAYAVDRLCEAVDENVFRTSQLVQHVDDVMEDMETVQRLASQLQAIKSRLAWLEGIVQQQQHQLLHQASSRP
ncbi:hypothetical protein BC831DRAFT_451423, partial [Entophlyctis helioformis]